MKDGGRSGLALYARLLGHARRYWPVAILAVLAMVVDAACMGLFARSIKPMIDNLFIARDPQSIFWMPIIIVAIFALRSLAIYATDYGTAYIGRGVVQQLRQKVFDHYLRLPASFFDAESSGHQIAARTETLSPAPPVGTPSVRSRSSASTRSRAGGRPAASTTRHHGTSAPARAST